MFLTKLLQLTDQYGKSFRLHLGCRANLVVSSPEAYERILSSSTQLNKVISVVFSFMILHFYTRVLTTNSYGHGLGKAY